MAKNWAAAHHITTLPQPLVQTFAALKASAAQAPSWQRLSQAACSGCLHKCHAAKHTEPCPAHEKAWAAYNRHHPGCIHTELCPALTHEGILVPYAVQMPLHANSALKPGQHNAQPHWVRMAEHTRTWHSGINTDTHTHTHSTKTHSTLRGTQLTHTPFTHCV